MGAVIRVYDEAGNVIETHEARGRVQGTLARHPYGLGAGVGRGLGVGGNRGVGVGLGVDVGLPVGVAVVVGVAVGVGVGVGLVCAQYLPPVFKSPTIKSNPPQTIISLPIHTAV